MKPTTQGLIPIEAIGDRKCLVDRQRIEKDTACHTCSDAGLAARFREQDLSCQPSTSPWDVAARRIGHQGSRSDAALRALHRVHPPIQACWRSNSTACSHRGRLDGNTGHECAEWTLTVTPNAVDAAPDDLGEMPRFGGSFIKRLS